MFSSTDLAQFHEKNISPEAVQEQIENFQNGFPFLDIQAAATVGNGIIRLEDSDVSTYIEWYESQQKNKKILKFVPASGAASRMFKALFAFKDSYDGTEGAYQEMLKDQGAKSLFTFFSQLKDFAFFKDLREVSRDSGTLGGLLLKKDFSKVLSLLLEKPGLGYGQLPKALLKFHKYAEGERTAVEEHLVEGAAYGRDGAGVVAIHFTVSPEHQAGFEALLSEVLPQYENLYKVHYDISYSVQKSSTDTLAVDLQNEPFRKEDGSILFRPGGHGALIYNLNELDADVIFIKNIDNVVPDHLKLETIRYKKALAGILLKYQERVFSYLEQLNGENPGSQIAEIESFPGKRLMRKAP